MKTTEVTFTHDKETKRKHRYSSPDDSEVQGNLYLDKEALGGDVPSQLKVTVEDANA